jgi:putative transposase
MSERRACRLMSMSRSSACYRSVKDPLLEVRARLREIAAVRVRYGYRRMHVLLRREGVQIGKHTMYRLYQEEQLQLRSKLPRRRKSQVVRRERFKPCRAGEVWSMDFVADQLADGSKLRMLTVIDIFSREALAIEVGKRLRGEDVVNTLDRLLAGGRQAPKYLFVDNGSEFSGRLLDLWAYHHRARIDFSRPAKPVDNCFVETFNRSLRDECLNVHWFVSIGQAKALIEGWRRDYNESRPHMALAGATPTENARRLGLPAQSTV